MGIELDGLVDTLAASSARLVETTLTERGFVLPPTVYLMSKYALPPLLGTVTTRPFYRGADAAGAVARLGVLPAAAQALRLLVVWENADLCAALDRPGWQAGRYPRGVVAVDAHRDERIGHMVRWQPFSVTAVDPVTQSGHGRLTAVALNWGTPQQYQDGQLPGEITNLLAVWRRPRPEDGVEALRAELTATGFVVTWKQPVG